MRLSGSGGLDALRAAIVTACLEWVRMQIALFGGDPACVTLFGQGCGHVLSPSCRFENKSAPDTSNELRLAAS